jgi:hypothetical protein
VRDGCGRIDRRFNYRGQTGAGTDSLWFDANQPHSGRSGTQRLQRFEQPECVALVGNPRAPCAEIANLRPAGHVHRAGRRAQAGRNQTTLPCRPAAATFSQGGSSFTSAHRMKNGRIINTIEVSSPSLVVSAIL